MITEEFTFPVITSNNVVNLALLPPLWRISSINLHSDDAEPERENGRKRKIFTSPLSSSGPGHITKTDAAEKKDEKAESEAQEKMDVLWEDFNEEELRSNVDSSGSDFSEETRRDRKNNSINSSGEECRNLPELKLIPAKGKKLELVVKMMRKLFSLQSTAAAATKKRGPN